MELMGRRSSRHLDPFPLRATSGGPDHTTVTQTAVVIDFLSGCGEGNVIHLALAMRFPRSLEHQLRIFNHLFRGSDELAMLIHLPTVSFTPRASPRRSAGKPVLCQNAI